MSRSPEERLDRLERFSKRLAVTGRRTRNDLRTNINALIDAQMRTEDLFNQTFARISAAQDRTDEEIKDLRAGQDKLAEANKENAVLIKETAVLVKETAVLVKENAVLIKKNAVAIEKLAALHDRLAESHEELAESHQELAASEVKFREEVAASQKQTDEKLRVLIKIVGLDRNGANN